MQRLLAVWAHPDDESFGPVGTVCLAHDHGYESMVITATRGEAGSAANLCLKPNQSLGDLREAELRAAIKVARISQLIVWDYPDGNLSSIAPAILTEKISTIMHDWQPEIVLTFGPDGITGHPDHIAISTATTAAFEHYRTTIRQPVRLLYAALPPNSIEVHKMGPAPDPLPSNIVLDVTAYVEIKREALACHASQRADWQEQVDHPSWLSRDYFHQAYPPIASYELQTSIFTNEAII